MSETNRQDEKKRVHAIVHGRVQGVGFRYSTIRTAQDLDLTGWVANRRDGTVEAVAEGPREALKKLVGFLHQGPPSAMVTNVDIKWKSPTDEFAGFRTRYL